MRHADDGFSSTSPSIRSIEERGDIIFRDAPFMDATLDATRRAAPNAPSRFWRDRVRMPCRAGGPASTAKFSLFVIRCGFT